MVVKGCIAGHHLESVAAIGKGSETLVTESGILHRQPKPRHGSQEIEILADKPTGSSSNPTQSDSNQSKFDRRLGHFGDRLRGLK